MIMASIFNLAGPDLLVILTAAREEIERELTHSGSSPAPEVKLPEVKN
jgi:hypothetical protein